MINFIELYLELENYFLLKDVIIVNDYYCALISKEVPIELSRPQVTFSLNKKLSSHQVSFLETKYSRPNNCEYYG